MKSSKPMAPIVLMLLAVGSASAARELQQIGKGFGFTSQSVAVAAPQAVYTPPIYTAPVYNQPVAMYNQPVAYGAQAAMVAPAYTSGGGLGDIKSKIDSFLGKTQTGPIPAAVYAQPAGAYAQPAPSAMVMQQPAYVAQPSFVQPQILTQTYAQTGYLPVQQPTYLAPQQPAATMQAPTYQQPQPQPEQQADYSAPAQQAPSESTTLSLPDVPDVSASVSIPGFNFSLPSVAVSMPSFSATTDAIRKAFQKMHPRITITKAPQNETRTAPAQVAAVPALPVVPVQPVVVVQQVPINTVAPVVSSSNTRPLYTITKPAKPFGKPFGLGR